MIAAEVEGQDTLDVAHLALVATEGTVVKGVTHGKAVLEAIKPVQSGEQPVELEVLLCRENQEAAPALEVICSFSDGASLIT